MKRRDLLIGSLGVLASGSVLAMVATKASAQGPRYVGEIIRDDDGVPRFVLAKDVKRGDRVTADQFLEVDYSGPKPELIPNRAQPMTPLPDYLARYVMGRHRFDG